MLVCAKFPEAQECGGGPQSAEESPVCDSGVLREGHGPVVHLPGLHRAAGQSPCYQGAGGQYTASGVDDWVCVCACVCVCVCVNLHATKKLVVSASLVGWMTGCVCVCRYGSISMLPRGWHQCTASGVDDWMWVFVWM